MHWASIVQNMIGHDALGQMDVMNPPSSLINHINIYDKETTQEARPSLIGKINTKDKGTNPDMRRNHNLTDQGQEQRGQPL